MTVYSNVLEMVGNTPLLELKNLDTGPCRLFAKLEMMNPAGSIKDRIGVVMLEEAERRGDIKPGDTLIEATAGNTGLGLALAAAQKGYRLILVIPDKMSQEKVFNCRAMGAEVILTRSDVGKGHPEYYQDLAARLAEEKGLYFINQFANPDNPLAHEKGTGPEIWEQMGHDVDAVVLGVGSSGTITGVGHYLKKVAPDVDIVLADPRGSVLADYIRTGELGEQGSWMVEGIGEDFIPSICDLSFVHTAYSIPDREAFAVGRELLHREGLLAGSSTGTLLAAALRYCREQTSPKRVVTLACDTGNKYLSKMYNDIWMWEHGFLDRDSAGDLRDLIPRLHSQRATVVVGPGDKLATAFKRMRDNGFSQLPVVDGDRLLGVLDEMALLRGLTEDGRDFNAEASEVMDRNFPVLAVDAGEAEARRRLSEVPAVAVVDGETFIGMLTRSDLLVGLRKQAG
ncbi:MAG: pyridoxal-phosphate dependent enzyme [Gammaproteobacteria bacterium]|jgi:cystathionine beta-synthase